jgi:hypothetical protein
MIYVGSSMGDRPVCVGEWKERVRTNTLVVLAETKFRDDLGFEPHNTKNKNPLKEREISMKEGEDFFFTTTTMIDLEGIVVSLVVSFVVVLPDPAGAMTSNRVIDWVWAQAGEAGAKHV